MNIKKIAAIGAVSATIALLALACGNNETQDLLPASEQSVGIGMPVPAANGNQPALDTEVVSVGMPVPAEGGAKPADETELVSIGMPVPGVPSVPEMFVGEGNDPSVEDDRPLTSAPITSADGIPVDHCNFIHNVDACFVNGEMPDVNLDEYMDLYFDARDHVTQDDPMTVMIKSVERVEWPDASLGKPDPDMMYAQVVTPGFKLTLEHEGLSYLFHTSANRVVFVSEG